MKHPLIAILRGLKPGETEDVVGALIETGFTAIEIPLNSPEPFRSIEIAVKMAPEGCLIGAGTVLTVADVNRLADVGGRLMVSPNVEPEVISAATVVEMASMARGVHVDPTINDYVSRLVDASRTADEIRLGVSVRGALALVRAAKTLAASSGRYYVTPDDVKALAEPVLAHRLVLDPEAEFEGVTTSSVIGQLLIEVPPPSDRAAV